MLKSAVLALAIVACIPVKPGLLGAPLAYTVDVAYSPPLTHSGPAVVVAALAPGVSAASSQVTTRNHNGIAHALVIAPVADQLVAKYTAAPMDAP
ncbi:uncharacterized protein Dsimw501_GD27811, isoform B [Drosophila simulans]|uniref:Uncharacterized protein, isoform A n=1 Tax=Drosophila simulans TaxID=7240 RepID=A0A0J9RZC3_DROSI|nr:uncharacterized protein Dsimw501_GD27811, isoform A [Drosophila simulans]KMZ00546.1 uncharacterized protein Dsimw501_GD27811, isoform B [Drosophila simulans]